MDKDLHIKLSDDMKGDDSQSNLKNNVNTPDFYTIQQKLLTGIINGRHPSSFPKNTELWYYYKKSNERLQYTSKGKPLFKSSISPVYSIDDPNSLFSIDEKETTTNKPSTHEFKGFKKEHIPHTQKINGIEIELSGGISIHYGMLIVVKNYLDEVVCINKLDEIRCKPINQLSVFDRIVFRIIDMNEPSNAASINFGDPIWLQVVDDNNVNNNPVNDLNNGNDNDSIDSETVFNPNGVLSNNGRIIAAKVFHLPSMSCIASSPSYLSSSEGNNATNTSSNISNASNASVLQQYKDMVGHACLMNILHKPTDPIHQQSNQREKSDEILDGIVNKYHSRFSATLGIIHMLL